MLKIVGEIKGQEIIDDNGLLKMGGKVLSYARINGFDDETAPVTNVAEYENCRVRNSDVIGFIQFSNDKVYLDDNSIGYVEMGRELELQPVLVFLILKAPQEIPISWKKLSGKTGVSGVRKYKNNPPICLQESDIPDVGLPESVRISPELAMDLYYHFCFIQGLVETLAFTERGIFLKKPNKDKFIFAL